MEARKMREGVRYTNFATSNSLNTTGAWHNGPFLFPVFAVQKAGGDRYGRVFAKPGEW